MSGTSYRKVPSTRGARLAALGRLTGSIAGGLLTEGAHRLARGERPHLSDLLLTPTNARRVTEQLSRMRGAAMKLGQMISLDAGDVLPEELTTILSRLRESAYMMPPRQLDRVLVEELGKDWRLRFRDFQPRAIAAASIGQVHEATLPDGRRVAVKVQYPGVAKSIDADVDNVAALLRLSGLLPPGLDVGPLLHAAKQQLHEEADYRREADQMARYAELLDGEAMFVVPRPLSELSTGRLLVMDLEAGLPIDALERAPRDQRNRAMQSLFALALRELFEFGFMQTDPNFANYRWRPESGQIVLLDFGAARPVPSETVEHYRRLLRAGLAEDRDGLRDALLAIGFISPAAMARHRRSIDAVIATVMDHFGRPGLFDFADRGFVERARGEIQAIAVDRAAWHVPPAETLFVQRKISGMALLAVRMAVELPLRDMVASAVLPTHALPAEQS